MAATLEGCHPEVQQRTWLVLAEDKQKDNRLWLSEGKRTYAQQLVFYSRALIAHPLNPTAWAAKPGTSNHERGVAVDIAAISPGKDDKYRADLCKKHGLKQVLKNEAWHYELDPRRKPILPATLPTKEEATKILSNTAVEILPVEGGYYVVASNGGVFCYGTAEFFGSTGNLKLNAPITNAALTPSHKGYYLVGADGGIFAFGDAKYLGSPNEKNVIGY